MYNQSYDEYIRSILGYPNNNQYDIYQDSIGYDTRNIANFNQNQNNELESCYPEIYRVVYPMVKKACQNLSGPVTKETIDRLTDELYMNIEGNDEVHLNINLNNNVGNVNSTTSQTEKQVKKENRETRQFNRGLSDIIRILLLRELLGRPGFPGNRPPFPQPGRPGRPPFRPPFNRDFDNIYEY